MAFAVAHGVGGSIAVPRSLSWTLGAAIIGLALTAVASAQGVKAFRSLNLGDSASTVCQKISSDKAFATDLTTACTSVSTEWSLFKGPPWGYFKVEGLTLLHPSYKVELLGHSLSTSLLFIDDRLYSLALRTWPNLKGVIAADALYEQYVAVLGRTMPVVPKHTASPTPKESSTVIDMYTWTEAGKAATVDLNTYDGDYWVNIIVVDPALQKTAQARIASGARLALKEEQRAQQEKAKQEEQQLNNAAKNF